MSFISSFEIIKVVVTEPSIFFCIPASAADSGAVNPNGIKALSASGLITCFTNDNFSNRRRRLPRNPPD